MSTVTAPWLSFCLFLTCIMAHYWLLSCMSHITNYIIYSFRLFSWYHKPWTAKLAWHLNVIKSAQWYNCLPVDCSAYKAFKAKRTSVFDCIFCFISTHLIPSYLYTWCFLQLSLAYLSTVSVTSVYFPFLPAQFPVINGSILFLSLKLKLWP